MKRVRKTKSMGNENLAIGPGTTTKMGAYLAGLALPPPRNETDRSYDPQQHQ